MNEHFYLILSNGMQFEVSEDDFWKTMESCKSIYGVDVRIREPHKYDFFYYHDDIPFGRHVYSGRSL